MDFALNVRKVDGVVIMDFTASTPSGNLLPQFARPCSELIDVLNQLSRSRNGSQLLLNVGVIMNLTFSC